MIEISEEYAMGLIGCFWDPDLEEFFGTDDCHGLRDQLYAQMLGWA